MADPIESRMNFIIEQQAQFTADIQILTERQAEMLRMIEAHSRQIDETRGMIGQLVNVTLSLAHHGEETDRRLKELAEAQIHTDQRLDALIDTVDKLVRRNRN